MIQQIQVNKISLKVLFETCARSRGAINEAPRQHYNVSLLQYTVSDHKIHNHVVHVYVITDHTRINQHVAPILFWHLSRHASDEDFKSCSQILFF